MNGNNYISVIEPKVLPFIKKNFRSDDSWWYIPDNAPCHKSDFTMKLMKKHKINVLDWPAVSSEHNVIENIWAIIDKKLVKSHPTSASELQQIISKLWTEIPTQICIDLIQSMTRGIRKWMYSSQKRYFSKILN